MSRAAIIFRRVGVTSTGRALFRIVHRDGRCVGARFCIGHARRRAKSEQERDR